MKIVIISNKEGYRRAGLGFRKGENVFDSEKLTAEQLKAIEADPNLTVKYDVELDDETATLAETLEKVTAERDEALAELKKLTEGITIGVNQIDELKAENKKQAAELEKANAEIEKLKKAAEKAAKKEAGK